MVLITPISETLDTGSAAFASVWRQWRHQWTQPQLLKIAETYLGARFFHSSQMTGFEMRTLREPGPRVFLAVGYLNLAHGRSLGLPEERLQPSKDIGLSPKLPGVLKDFWGGRQPLCDANGIVLGPTGLFEAFTGLRELPQQMMRSIAPEHEQSASQALGKYLRIKLGSEGIDWMMDMAKLKSRCPCIEELLLNQTVPGDQLIASLHKLAGLADTTEEKLWNVITTSLST